MTATAGKRDSPGRGALRRASSPQGPSLSLLAAIVPTALLLVLAMATLAAWSSLKPSMANLTAASPHQPSAPTANNAGGLLSQAFTPQVLRWSPQINRWAHQTGLDPNLIAVVMQIESCGDPLAESPSGALGLFQVMPYHFLANEDPFDPDTNAFRGLNYLSIGYDLAGHDSGRALAGYNGGHSLIGLTAQGWPDETRRYVLWGTGLLNDITGGRVPSPTLSRWLQAGGDALCAQAQSARLPLSVSP